MRAVDGKQEIYLEWPKVGESLVFCLRVWIGKTSDARCLVKVNKKVNRITIWTRVTPSVVSKHQFFRVRPVTLLKNRVWTRSLVKPGA